MSKIVPCLWYEGEAEEAARFYVSLLPDSRIDSVTRNPTDTPSGPSGSVLVVTFTLAGQGFMALNGGSKVQYNHAVSFQIDCVDQEEVDRLWDALLADGGQAEQCGWLHDRFGVPWQVVPRLLPKLLSGSDPAASARAMQAMMGMVKIDTVALQAAYDGR